MLIKKAFNKKYINKSYNKPFFIKQSSTLKKRKNSKIILFLFFLFAAFFIALCFIILKKQKNQDAIIIIEPSKTPYKIIYHHKIEESYMRKNLYTPFSEESEKALKIILHENNKIINLVEILRKDVYEAWKSKNIDKTLAYFKLDTNLHTEFNLNQTQTTEKIVVRNVLSSNPNYKLKPSKREYKVKINLCSSIKEVESLKKEVISRHPIMFTKHNFLIEQILNEGEVLYYLSLGPYKNYGSANAIAQQMKKIGYQCFVYK